MSQGSSTVRKSSAPPRSNIEEEKAQPLVQSKLDEAYDYRA